MLVYEESALEQFLSY